MLFNSYEFLFVFLPATLAIFFLVGRASGWLALGWLIIASLIFYAWWNPANLLIILTSLFVNYCCATVLVRVVNGDHDTRNSTLILVVGVTLNLLFLGYFKYANFLQATLNDLAGTQFVLQQVVLPLGISFFTFQQIAFLIDIHGRNIESFRARDFFLFVLFFPQLIAGPIVHYREMMPQFLSNACRFDAGRISAGLTLFIFGLFKKVVLADGIAPHVSAIYAVAESGETVSFFPAWIAAIGFTLQIYFDFSGYSDMAAGIGRLFGIRLPINFDSPLKATSIISFWSRWHITLTRFLTAYIYNPLALWQTRRRLSRGLPGHGGQRSSVGAFVWVLAVPTILTMFLSGLWHGAGYLFVLWGVVHGIFLVINHAWRQIGPGLWPSKQSYESSMRPVGFVLTFLSVCTAMILFRSATPEAALILLEGLTGMQGVQWPFFMLEQTSKGLFLQAVGEVPGVATGVELLVAMVWMVGLLLLALIPPNSLQIMTNVKPVLGMTAANAARGWWGRVLVWNPSFSWLLITAGLAGVVITRLSEDSEFLYWQF